MSRVKEFNLPDLGEGLTEGEILTWLVSVGDTIALNQPIVEVETAKAAVEIPAKWAGQVLQIFHPEGSTVEVGSPLMAIDTDPGAGPLPAGAGPAGGTVTPAGAATPAPTGRTVPGGTPASRAPVPGESGAPESGGRTPVLVGYGPRTGAARRRPRVPSTDAPAGTRPQPAQPHPTGPDPAERARIEPQPVEPQQAEPRPVQPSRVEAVPAEPPPVNGGPPRQAVALAKPPVRRLARDLGVDLATLVGSGPQGSITREDVQAAVAPVGAVAAAESADDQRIPVKGVRRLTAESMVASAFTAPHVTEFLTVDVTRSMRALDRLRDHRDWREVRLSPLLLVAKAVLVALRRHPMVNSSWAGDEIIVKRRVNLGIAAATDRGLIVPNVKDAGRLTLRELADALTALVQTAKAGRTTPADMADGTFTITNVGVFGVDSGTPILPPGEAAILALGAIREAPWVHHGKIKVRQVTTLSLSFDHRIIDGELGSRFLRDVGDFLTDPQTSLLAWG